jgi:hypothetical protein
LLAARPVVEKTLRTTLKAVALFKLLKLRHLHPVLFV